MDVAPASKFEVVPLGFDLSPFAVADAQRARARSRLRSELGIAAEAGVVTLIARLVPIKRVDRFLRLAQRLRDLPDVRFLVVGDGELRESLLQSADAQSLGDLVVWAGFRRDMPGVYFASDVVVQTSDNEGTPVSLIEAQAAGVPVVSTRVGGAASVVPADGLSDRDDEAGLAWAVRRLVGDHELAAGAGAAGRARVLNTFAIERLVSDLKGVYETAPTTYQPSRRRNTSRVSSSHSAWP